MKYANVDGRICQVVGNVDDHGPELVKADIITGTRTLRSTAGKRPGPGYVQVPGQTRKWVKHIPQSLSLSIVKGS